MANRWQLSLLFCSRFIVIICRSDSVENKGVIFMQMSKLSVREGCGRQGFLLFLLWVRFPCFCPVLEFVMNIFSGVISVIFSYPLLLFVFCWTAGSCRRDPLARVERPQVRGWEVSFCSCIGRPCVRCESWCTSVV